MTEKPGRYSTLYPETSAPPHYEIEAAQNEIGSPHNEIQTSHYEVQNAVTNIVSEKPIVVPQSTNLFFIKTFSPFARCYAPALAELSNPIHPEEFLAFIDRLNHVFISNPIFQAAHITGGILMGSQVLPAMAVGGVLQFGSVVASAGVSFVRVRKFMKEANATIFAPRGLVCKLQTTKKMMAEVGFTDTDAQGKLKLPLLEDVQDLGAYNPELAIENGPEGEKPLENDPRLLRLRALEGYIAPLGFDVPANPTAEGKLSKMGQAPLRWMNKKQMRKIDDAKAKSLKKREKFSAKVEVEKIKAQNEIAELDRRMEGLSEAERLELEMEKKLELEKRDTAIADIYKGADKKINKVYKKEEKVTNRILWIVIHRADGTDDDSLFGVGTTTTV